jgi:fructosamine-3-kinase
VIDAIAEACGSPVARSRPTAGGSINEALEVQLADGRRLFVKHRRDAPDGFYAAEAAGLAWLAAAGALPLPAPVAVTGAFLALEWVDPGPRGPGFDEALGRGLAALHRAGAERFGATADGGPTFLGSLAVPNAGAPDWPAFYAGQRLEPLLRMAVDARVLPGGGATAVQRVIDRIEALCGPPEPPARLHGDLWSGNVHAGPAGEPWVIDPAAHGGHREVDLAMLGLFGGPGRDFLPAYEEVDPLADGHEDRVALYELLPLLVHAVLFGGHYGAAAVRAATSYR